MKKLKVSKGIRIFIAFCICATFNLHAQTSNINFPDDFFGNYKGVLDIHNAKGITKYPMEFQLQPTDSLGHYQYTLIYGDGDNRQVRPYTLKAINKDNGTYIIDENNGIILDEKVIENRMYTVFEVGGTLLTTFITFEENQMLFEIVVIKVANKNSSGGTSEEIPEVFSYPITTVQRAILTKEK